MTSRLTGLEARPDPVVHRCACGCRAYADRGMPSGLWYWTPHVPPAMRFPWEAGAIAPCDAPARPTGPAACAPPQPDLFPV